MNEQEKNIHNPQDVGCGCWYLIHLIAANLDVETILKVIHLVENKFHCMKCRRHFNEFIKMDPPEAYAGEQLFEWTYRAHNNGNKNANPNTPVVPYSLVQPMYYSDASICTSDCGAKTTSKSDDEEEETEEDDDYPFIPVLNR